jgi:four helix bundle protein
LRDFKNLHVWEKSHRLALAVYRESSELPESERFGLQSQMRRAAVSVPANIAEGYGRETDREFVRFLHVSAGSATELEYHLLLAWELGYISAEAYGNLNDQVLEVQRMIAGFIRRIQSGSRQS